MSVLLIILYSLLSLFLLAGIVFLAVGIYVLIYIKRHVKRLSDKAHDTIHVIGENHAGFLGKIFGIPFIAYLAQKLVRRFLW